MDHVNAAKSLEFYTGLSQRMLLGRRFEPMKKDIKKSFRVFVYFFLHHARHVMTSRDHATQ